MVKAYHLHSKSRSENCHFFGDSKTLSSMLFREKIVSSYFAVTNFVPFLVFHFYTVDYLNAHLFVCLLHINIDLFCFQLHLDQVLDCFLGKIFLFFLASFNI